MSKTGLCACAACLAAIVSVGLASAGCNSCPFQVIRVQTVAGTLEPGAFAIRDVTVADEHSLAVDLASSATTEPGRRVDAWLVPADCAQLFNEPYPGTSAGAPIPQCRVLAGPIAPNSVSARLETSPGQHRVIVQAWATNTGAADYDFELGTWGRTCRYLTPTRPR